MVPPSDEHAKFTTLFLQMKLIANVRCPYIVEYKYCWVDKVSMVLACPICAYVILAGSREQSLLLCPSFMFH
jgi:hypothetical protein